MMSMKELPNEGTISLEGGKYQFVLDEQGMLVKALRNGEYWPAGMEYAYSKSVMSMLWRIQVLSLEKTLAANNISSERKPNGNQIL